MAIKTLRYKCGSRNTDTPLLLNKMTSDLQKEK